MTGKACSGVAAVLKCRAFWKNMFICNALDVSVQGNFVHCVALHWFKKLQILLGLYEPA